MRHVGNKLLTRLIQVFQLPDGLHDCLRNVPRLPIRFYINILIQISLCHHIELLLQAAEWFQQASRRQ